MKKIKFLTPFLTIIFVILMNTSNVFASFFNDEAPKANLNLSLIQEAVAKIKSNYISEVKDEELINSAIDGMLSSLDPHSSYLTEEELNKLAHATKGEFGGLGIEVIMENGIIKIISAIENTPADQAGLKAGDLIVAIEHNPVIKMSLTEAVNKMRGKPNTKINITVSRAAEKDLKHFTIKREIIKTNPVRSDIFENVAYLRISNFAENTNKKLVTEFNTIRTKLGDKLGGIILDLRGNPGGLLTQSIEVAESFIGQGKIVSTKGNNNNEVSVFYAKKKDIANGLPMVVLINNGSASASEIVAGALQDHNRAIIMGNKSFGKGSVQTIIPLSKGAIKITTSKYYTPKNREIQAQGIVPDIEVQAAQIKTIKEEKINLRENGLKNHLSNNKEIITKTVKEEFNQKLYDSDFQLARAIDLVKSLAMIKKYDVGKNEKN